MNPNRLQDKRLTNSAENIEVYNILSDSIGMTPQPNNGTLRLPLKPIGIHKPEETPGEQADPPTADSSASEAPKRPTIAVPPSEVPRPTMPGKPSETPAHQGDQEDANAGDDKGIKEHEDEDQDQDKDGDKDENDKDEDGPGGWWDWVKDKAHYVWHKVGHAWEKVTGSSG
jgi:hypothetical protein